jgi:hypothetical protein
MSGMRLENKQDLPSSFGLKYFPKLIQKLLRLFLILFSLGGSVFVVGHYIFAPPICTPQQAQTCNCPLW